MKRKIMMGIILVSVMLLALAASPVFGGNGANGLDKAQEAQERHSARLLAIDGVEKAPQGTTVPTAEAQCSSLPPHQAIREYRMSWTE